MKANIYPCPFCGETPNLTKKYKNNQEDIFKIECCSTMINNIRKGEEGENDIEKIIKKWNYRPIKEKIENFIDKENWEGDAQVTKKYTEIREQIIYNVYIKEEPRFKPVVNLF